ncbi:hypothetical protein ACI65C_006985, partial [Semiaphis heraclei]
MKLHAQILIWGVVPILNFVNIDDNHYHYDMENQYKNLITSYEIVMNHSLTRDKVKNIKDDSDWSQNFQKELNLIIDN